MALLNKLKNSLLVALLIILSSSSQSEAQVLFEAEGGITFSGYNDIRVPGDEGTTFDAAKDLGRDLRFAYRLRAGYRINEKHNFFLLYAPLKLKYAGNLPNVVEFNGATFSPDKNTNVDYVFNSYRLTYRYDFIITDKIRVGAGITAKIRDAYIQVSQDGISSKKKNLGVVPLINIMASVQFNDTFGLLFEGDGLATGKGRAFDLQLSVPIKFDEYTGIKVGYRVLEGGANNDEVYNFTWVNYIHAGIFYNFY